MKVSSIVDIPSVAKYLHRIQAEPRSMRTAVVKEIQGKYWRDVAVIKFGADGTVEAPENYEPTEAEQNQIKAEFSSAIFPSHVRLSKLINLPPQLAQAPKDSIYEFLDEQNKIIMLQQRIDPRGDQDETEKRYVPWTFWDDNQWRKAEPEGGLPLWGLDQLKDNSTVFIHEGAKAAKRVRDMVEKWAGSNRSRSVEVHPWLEELSGAAHVGWIGGALSPYRTDWQAIMRLGIKRAYIVSDNDSPGVAAVGPISFMLRIPTFHVQFTSEFPVGFDLGDEFPKSMFRKIDEIRHYVGPNFQSCVHPATWATDRITPKKGKPIIVLRENFKGMWSYVEEADVYVCNEMTDVIRPEKILNTMLSGFSHSSNTCQLMASAYRGRNVKLSYRPDLPSGLIANGDTSAINLHKPTRVKTVVGDFSPFVEFMTYMFPNAKERHEIMRWCATLIAQPEVRMEYGILLISEMQGIGKTTLGQKILAPLVGEINTGFPSESEVTESNFNGWLANKRLIVIGEIYSGHSWKAYQRLKGYITDDKIEVNQKYMRSYTIENWIHVFACSNSMKALKVEENDRRWHCPKVTEVKWPVEKFKALNDWINSGGLSIIKYWAEQFGDYVKKGEKAPDSVMKTELIRESYSDEEREAEAVCEAIQADKVDCVIALKSMVNWTKSRIQGRTFSNDHQIKKAMMRQGFKASDKRIRVAGILQVMMISPSLFEKNRDLLSADEYDNETMIEFLRKHIKMPEEIIAPDM